MLQELLQPPGNHQIMDEAAMPLANPSSKCMQALGLCIREQFITVYLFVVSTRTILESQATLASLVV